MHIFDNDDKLIIMELAYNLTKINFNLIHEDIILQSFSKRILETKCNNLIEYLSFANEDIKELDYLLSSLTIHFTSWFREPATLDEFLKVLKCLILDKKKNHVRFLSIGCSTGEEVYTFASILESMRINNNEFEYQIEGWDIDAISIQTAMQAEYKTTALVDEVPLKYNQILSPNFNLNDEYFRISKNILQRTKFKKINILDSAIFPAEFDFISCRNLLIYFKKKQIESITNTINSLLNKNGILITGLSEMNVIPKQKFVSIGRGIFKKYEIKQKIQMVEKNNLIKLPKEFRPDLICIGASTGGTDVLIKMLAKIKKPCPPIMIVQHIFSNFSSEFAKKISDIANLELGIIENNSALKQNTIYMSLGDYHIGIHKLNGLLCLKLDSSSPILNHRPSIDFLFKSIANLKIKAFAILLTGMGKDGALGLSELRQNG